MKINPEKFIAPSDSRTFSTSRLLGFFLIAWVSAAFFSCGKPRDGVVRPNIIVVLCDDLGYGDIGGTLIQTPRLNELANRGLLLTHCYSGAPVCSPARAAFMTGRVPNRSGIRDWIPQGSGIFLDTAEVTVAELLSKAGYATALIGKWHLNSRIDGSEPTPNDHGFEFAFYTQNNASPNHLNPHNFIRQGQPMGTIQGPSTNLVVDTAIAWIMRQKKPFAAFITLHAPHEPLRTPVDWTNQYAQFEDTTQRIYYGSVSLIDDAVGRLIDSLEALGLRENTLIWFTSDVGPETLNRYPGAERSHGSPGNLRGMKLHITEAGYRVPGILYWPGHTRPGSVSNEPICAYDALPTFAALAGAPLPEGIRLDGANFLPILKGKPVPRSQPFYWQYDFALSQPWQVALRDGNWKLVANADLSEFALFDLGKDESEHHNKLHEHPEKAQRLISEMRRLHQEINP